MSHPFGVCHVCGRAVSTADLEKGRAVLLLKRRYCRDCADAISAGRRRPSPLAAFFAQTWKNW